MNPNLATDAGASCADAPLPLPIDVVALSAGLPNGTYYPSRKPKGHESSSAPSGV